jgi:hypothetical protein
MKKIFIAVAVAATALSLSACNPGSFDKMTEQFQDAPIGPRVNKPVTIIEMPDGYANVATVCDKGMRYSTTTVGTANEVRALSVVADPTCK